MATALDYRRRRDDQKWDVKRYPSNIRELEERFVAKIHRYLETAFWHNEAVNINEARCRVPLDDLSQKAKLHLENVTKGLIKPSIQGNPLDFRDCLLLELMFWFKTHFFTWFNNPVCSSCGQPQVHRVINGEPYVRPTEQEKLWCADRVELYHCQVCSTETRFPRYNHPRKLLETRVGRCGEWANCFTLVCRALDFEARFVVDWTDHVWTEVYSDSQNRWLHCDPCENVCDAPLLYEVGWKKKLSYILAFSNYDIQDVTWRYTSNQAEILRRRLECREEWLLSQLLRIRKDLQVRLDPNLLAVYEDRLVCELVEMMTPKVVKENETFGRISGSLEWRQQRGETGSQLQPVVFTPTSSEMSSKIFKLRYNIATDTYVRCSSDNAELKGWEAGVYRHKGIFRKVERDWNFVYFARYEGQDSGEVEWKFECTNTAFRVSEVVLKYSHWQTEDGKVLWTISNGSKTQVVPSGSEEYKTKDFENSEEVIVSAKVFGGNNWQHAQLFRQSTADINSFPFELTVHLSDSSN